MCIFNANIYRIQYYFHTHIVDKVYIITILKCWLGYYFRHHIVAIVCLVAYVGYSISTISMCWIQYHCSFHMVDTYCIITISMGWIKFYSCVHVLNRVLLLSPYGRHIISTAVSNWLYSVIQMWVPLKNSKRELRRRELKIIRI